jgi:hypothetical protein
MQGQRHGSFIGLMGENCTFGSIRGVKVFEDSNGRDIIKIIDSLEKGSFGHQSTQSQPSSQVLETLDLLSKRIESIENFLGSLRIEKGPKGDKGDKGEDGEKGEAGPQGPRGKGADKMASLLERRNGWLALRKPRKDH